MLVSSLDLDMEQRLTVLVFGLLFPGATLFAQSSVDALGGASDAAQRVFDNTTTQAVDTLHEVSALQVLPGFPGGQAAMAEFLKATITYPEKEWEDGIQGRVYVQFVVATDGAIRNIVLKRGVSPGLDSEALRAVAAMPRWSPGMLDGRPVRVRFTLPVDFSLAKEPPPVEALPDGTR